jgi:hypothetical protein
VIQSHSDPDRIELPTYPLLPDLNRYVGVALAVVGSVVVAPRAPLLWRSTMDWLRQRKRELRGQLARFLRGCASFRSPRCPRKAAMRCSAVTTLAAGVSRAAARTLSV